MQVVARELTRLEHPKLAAHLLALDAEDRRLRFGLPIADASIADYVERIDFERDALFGVFDDELNLVGAAHLARAEDHAELGVSVLPAHRGRGIGGTLLERAHMHARNWGIGTLFMHCLSENAAMMHLARKQGMRIATASGEADAHLALPPASPSSITGALIAERAGLFDYALKSQMVNARRLLGAFAAPKAPGSGRGS
jgi:RimJ/RimL family protein N-acetyltransferase